MNLTCFLKKNLTWSFSKDVFAHLCGCSSTEKQLVAQLYKLSDGYFPLRKKVEIANTEFCLNEIALWRAKTPPQEFVKQHFEEMWATFLRLKSIFDKDYMMFPADSKKTRLEAIAELVTQCTQCAVTTTAVAEICEKTREIFDLDEREQRNLENVLALYRVNFFCAVAREIFLGNQNCETRLARLFDLHPLNIPFEDNKQLRHACYTSQKLVSNLDCLANSATKLATPTAIDVKPYFYINGKNVFDTFCQSKFGNHTAEFQSQSSKIEVSMQYFLDGRKEVRRYCVQNLGKGNKKLVADFLLRHLNVGCKTTFFEANGALCLSVSGDNEFYCALALVHNNKIVPCPFEEGRLSARFVLPQTGKTTFDVVTLYAEDMPTLSDSLDDLCCFGATRCPYLWDGKSDSTVEFHNPLYLSVHGHTKRSAPKKEATTLNFTYQLGNDNVATFLDNAGNCTTLLGGFVFGVEGEKVYSVKNGAISQLNNDRFTLESEKLVYKKEDGALCTVTHNTQKIYDVCYPTPRKTLFYFPFEEKCNVVFQNNTFVVTGGLRKFALHCTGRVESFTTNALECNTERLRYKLSGEDQCGSCLAVCFATEKQVSLSIESLAETPAPSPLIKESLVSTYLNYVNNKNVFCLNNFLKRCDSLSLAAITFTNPQFVKHYLANIWGKQSFYYDVTGRRKKFFDKLALPLAAVYYANVACDGEFPTEELKQYVNSIIFRDAYKGYELCVKALVLKKAAHIKGFDKVRCLIEYNNVKKIISADAKLYGYAQAIGALPITHPSKERLKDLCNKFDIPKSWYYVSQLENLYGLSLVEGVLNFRPSVSQENVLEQLALNIAGKRIDTFFAKSTVQSMTLNGTQYFAPFRPQSLKNDVNTLVVRY